MKLFKHFLVLAIIVPFIAACGGKYSYETVEGDPMNTRIYTLDNGLKVFMTVNDMEPRFQANIAVRVGGKNDPKETTGLAHYFEHLMFKGSEQFGTTDYAAEKVLLDQIEAEFEHYRTLTDEAERAKVYARIDSLSYEASKIFIPNEYDKLMSTIGAKGTNAYTGYDMTVYVENIPSNQIENWAKVQGDRFKHNVIRGFHTELETVYEEKNMSLTNDSRKSIEAMFSAILPNHPYGTQTVLGTQEHLKNPSITNIKNYYKEWYVPNNMAICISGDFDPEVMIATIDKYFGDMEPNKNLKKLEYEPAPAITEPIVKEVYGLEAPNTILAWRFDGLASAQNDTLSLLGDVLFNGRAGIMDLNVNQKQRTLGAYAFPYAQADYTVFLLQGMPKQGQTLEQVKEILLEQIELLKKGEFDESLLTAAINQAKRSKLSQMESNYARAEMFVDAFINGYSWESSVNELDRLSKITKEDIVKFANRHFADNYVVVNKLQGEDKTVQKIAKPKITPIQTNRDNASEFLKNVQASVVEPIAPVFVDYAKDMQVLKAKSDIDVLYKENTTNALFELVYLFDMGRNEDKVLGVASDYLDYLGTDKYSAAELKQKLYNLACDFSVSVSSKETAVYLSGLAENMGEALTLVEDFMANCTPDEAALANLKKDLLLGRSNAKLNQSRNFSALNDYVKYGPVNATNSVMSNAQIQALTSKELIAKIKGLMDYKHTVMYYGPEDAGEFVANLDAVHNVKEQLKDVPARKEYAPVATNEDKVFIAPYDAKQIYMMSYSNTGETYNKEIEPIRNMYANYFGGGMNGIVFQEMREARGLAYTARASYSLGVQKPDAPYVFTTMIATQNDKMMDAITAFDEIINNMPQSEAAFNIAKENILANIRTTRVLGSQILWSYRAAKKMGNTEDSRKAIFEKTQAFTLADVVKFQQDVIKGRKYYIGILGTEKDLDMKTLGNGSYGKVVRLTQKDIFGY